MRSLLLALTLVALAGCSSEGGSAPADAGAPDSGRPPLPVPLAPGVSARPDGVLRLATWNVRRLFDATCDSGQCGPGDFEEQPTEQAFLGHVQSIADDILSLDPTAVALQEIETQVALDALTARLTPFLPYAVLGEIGTPGSVDVAVVSALPILEVRRHRDQVLTRPDGTTTTFSRELLEVHLDAGGGRRVVLVSAHFRSQVNDDPGRRLAEAQAAAAIVAATGAELPAALVVLAGDLNDAPGSPPIDALEASGALVRVEAELPPAEQVTVYDAYGALAIDHLLRDVAAGGAVVAGSARVARDAPGFGLGESDHAALLADFTLPPWHTNRVESSRSPWTCEGRGTPQRRSRLEAWGLRAELPDQPRQVAPAPPRATPRIEHAR
jgi:endonuclease/exonuclease/phosphatase family metal-dependent hydrolase